MGVLMRAFSWDCPREESQEHGWRSFVGTKHSELRGAGFTALWPPGQQGANIGRMSFYT